MRKGIAGEAGAALLIVMLAIGLFASLSAAVLLTSSSEVVIAAQFRDERGAFYAADAIVERALVDVAAAPDWNAIASGAAQSSFVDGPPGARVLDDGRVIDLAQIVNMANCQKTSACTIADLNAVTAQRPWGADNPRWHVYASGWLRDLAPTSPLDSPWYVAGLAAADPLHGTDTICMRGEAFGPHSAHVIVELTAARSGADSDYNERTAVRSVSWREVR